MLPTRMLAMRQTRPLFMQQSRPLLIQQTRPLLRPVPKEEHSAHTISQRIRTLKKVPPELIPLGVVLSVAICAAIIAITRKLMTDKTLRLTRSKPGDH